MINLYQLIMNKFLQEKNEEIWKPIKGYEGIYDVSNKGRIRSYSLLGKASNTKNELLIRKVRSNVFGYYIVDLRKNGKRETFLVHRLVAREFIPNTENKKQINHKNGIKTDNSVENLEWSTSKENMQHAIKAGLLKCKSGRKVNKNPLIVFDLAGNYVTTLYGVKQWVNFGLKEQAVNYCLRGILKSHKGYVLKRDDTSAQLLLL